MRIFLVILAALIVAGGTGFYVLQGLRPAAPEVAQAAAPQLRQVFVPAAEVPIGTIITPEWLSRMEITEGALNGEMILADAAGDEFLAGSVARQVLPQGVPIARSFVVRPGDRGFLAAVLPKGMRAITIPVDEIAGLSGLALPGDRVDLILTYSVSGDAGSGIRASETVHLQPPGARLRPAPRAGGAARGQGRQGRGRAGRADRDPRGLAAPGRDHHPGPDPRHPLAGAQFGARRRASDKAGQDRGGRASARTAPSFLKAAEATGGTAPDARVRRDLDQQGADRARRDRSAPRPPPAKRRPPPRRPPPSKPTHTG